MAQDMEARDSLNISSVGRKVGLMHCQIIGAQHEAHRPGRPTTVGKSVVGLL